MAKFFVKFLSNYTTCHKLIGKTMDKSTINDRFFRKKGHLVNFCRLEKMLRNRWEEQTEKSAHLCAPFIKRHSKDGQQGRKSILKRMVKIGKICVFCGFFKDRKEIKRKDCCVCKFPGNIRTVKVDKIGVER